MIRYIGQAARAFYAGAAAFIGTTAAALTSDQNLGDLTTQTWLVIAGTTLAAFFGVYGISNAKPAK